MRTTAEAVSYLRMVEAQNQEVRRGNASIRHSQLHVSNVMVDFANQESIKSKIESVQDYFIKKLIDGDFIITEYAETHVMLKIDEDYQFAVWIGNDVKFCHAWPALGINFMQLPQFDTDQQVLIHARLKQMSEDNKEEIRLRRIEKLQKELNSLQ